MFFWNINKLKKELIENTINQRSLFAYIFIYVVLIEAAVEVEAYTPGTDFNNYDYALSVIYLIIVSVGTYLAYVLNGGNDGREFAERYFSIGFVIGIRFLVFLGPIVVVAVYLQSIELGAQEDNSTQWYEVLIFSVVVITFYWRYLVHINDVAKKSKKT